ncbi:MAG: hypothetical protein BAJALOKI3v1_340026 [Promethearchaeota archaeon]|nr:MAG: hypothetical protein BAJALOKI3v1_340026 [Candidatus Lokiarchaeota archaeon]
MKCSINYRKRNNININKKYDLKINNTLEFLKGVYVDFWRY